MGGTGVIETGGVENLMWRRSEDMCEEANEVGESDYPHKLHSHTCAINAAFARYKQISL